MVASTSSSIAILYFSLTSIVTISVYQSHLWVSDFFFQGKVDDGELRGITPRIVYDIFKHTKKLPPHVEVQIKVSLVSSTILYRTLLFQEPGTCSFLVPYFQVVTFFLQYIRAKQIYICTSIILIARM